MPQLPSFDLTGKAALVTGAARGLGRAISLALAAAGADVALGLRDKSSDSGLAKEVEKLGRRALPLQMDCLKLDEISQAISSAHNHFGHLDILVNNVGYGFTTLALDVPEHEFDTTIALNFKSTFFASQAAARLMIPQGGGRIINMSSQAAYA